MTKPSEDEEGLEILNNLVVVMHDALVEGITKALMQRCWREACRRFYLETGEDRSE